MITNDMEKPIRRSRFSMNKKSEQLKFLRILRVILSKSSKISGSLSGSTNVLATCSMTKRIYHYQLVQPDDEIVTLRSKLKEVEDAKDSTRD
jgi:hypothetical protein